MLQCLVTFFEEKSIGTLKICCIIYDEAARIPLNSTDPAFV